MSSVSSDETTLLPFQCIACGDHNDETYFYRSIMGDLCRQCYLTKLDVRQNKHAQKGTKKVFVVMTPPKK